MTITHELNCEAVYFDAVVDGTKTFEIRKRDRPFQAGDYLHLLRGETDGNVFKPDGNSVSRRISYVLTDHAGLNSAYCILGLDQPACARGHAAEVERCSYAEIGGRITGETQGSNLGPVDRNDAVPISPPDLIIQFRDNGFRAALQ